MKTLRMYYQENLMDAVTEKELQDRMARVRVFLKDRGLAAVLIFLPGHEGYRQWLAGTLKQGDQAEGAVLLGLEGPVYSYQSNGCVPPGEENTPFSGGIPPAPADFTCVRALPRLDVRDIERCFAQAGGLRQLGVVHPAPVNARLWDELNRLLCDVEWVDVTGELAMVKGVVSPLEREIWSVNTRWMDQTFQGVCAMLTEGRTEYDIAREITYVARRLGSGGEFVSLTAPVRVCSGQQGEKPAEAPFAFPGRRLREGDRINIRAWITFHSFYRTTLSRMWTLGPAAEQTRLRWQAALTAQQLAADRLTPGATLEDVAASVNASLREWGLPEARNLFLHGLGYEPEQRPCQFDPSARLPLLDGTILAIEPLLDFGDEDPYCVGDPFIVTPGGAKRLSRLPREIVEL